MGPDWIEVAISHPYVALALMLVRPLTYFVHDVLADMALRICGVSPEQRAEQACLRQDVRRRRWWQRGSRESSSENPKPSS